MKTEGKALGKLGRENMNLVKKKNPREGERQKKWRYSRKEGS